MKGEKTQVRRLDAIEIAALEAQLKEMYLKKLKKTRPNCYEGVLRLVAIEESRLLIVEGRKCGKSKQVEQSINNAMEKAKC